MLKILQRLCRTSASPEPRELDLGLISDCQLAGLEIPYELLDAWGTELGRALKPGETAAAIYAWQAALKFRALEPQTKRIVANCLRPLPKATPTVLALEEVLPLMLFRGESIRGTLESLAYLRIAGSDLIDIPDSLSAQEHLDQIPTAAAATYWNDAVHISEMIEQGMTECEIERGSQILALLETSAWAMATAELEGKGYIGSIGPEYRIVANSDPESADRLLIRLHQGRLHFGPSNGEPQFLDVLPNHYSRVFYGDWNSVIDLGSDLLDLEALPAEQRLLPSDGVGLVAGQQVAIGNFTFFFSQQAQQAWRCEHQLFEHWFDFLVIIENPRGVIGATVRAWSESQDLSDVTITELSFVDCDKIETDDIDGVLRDGLQELLRRAIMDVYMHEYTC